MSLFLRRQLQRYIDDLDGVIRADALRGLVGNLNRPKAGPLGFEWELVLLWALSRTFRVEYEPGLPNAPKVDLVVHRPGEQPPSFAAEIKSVSDLSRHEENNVEKFLRLLAVAMEDTGLRAQVNYRIEGGPLGEYRDAKVILSLPKTDDAWHKVDKRIRDYFTVCKKSPQAPLQIADVAMVNISVERGYGISGSYLAYTTNYSLNNNPVISALTDKAKSLNRVRPRPANVVGIILCDRGCRILNDRTSSCVGGEVTLREVVTAFL